MIFVRSAAQTLKGRVAQKDVKILTVSQEATRRCDLFVGEKRTEEMLSKGGEDISIWSVQWIRI